MAITARSVNSLSEGFWRLLGMGVGGCEETCNHTRREATPALCAVQCQCSPPTPRESLTHFRGVCHHTPRADIPLCKRSGTRRTHPRGSSGTWLCGHQLHPAGQRSAQCLPRHPLSCPTDPMRQNTLQHWCHIISP